MPTPRAMLAEFVGTFALMFVGGGAIVVNAALDGGGSGLLGVALAHGLILGVMVSATMHVSGGQLNPAVAIALAVIREQPWPRAAVFVVTQALGATAAAALLAVLLGPLAAVGGGGETAVEAARLGATLGGMGLGPAAVFGLEVVATFFLMFVILGTAVDRRGVGGTAAVGGFAIGLTVAADILCFGPLTGASMNPARSLGPALVGGHWTLHWVYWLAPITGAIGAAVAYRFTFGQGRDRE